MCEERRKESCAVFWSLVLVSLSDGRLARLLSLKPKQTENGKKREAKKKTPSEVLDEREKRRERGDVDEIGSWGKKRPHDWALFFFTNNFYSCDDGESVKETERSFERRRHIGGAFMSQEEEMRCVWVERDDEKRTKNDHDEAFFLR